MAADFFRDTSLAEVGADLCWDGLGDRRRVVLLQRDAGAVAPSLRLQRTHFLPFSWFLRQKSCCAVVLANKRVPP